jgi:hypothetical protein
LRRLVQLRPGEQAVVEDLGKYVHDLRNTEIQGSLLVYLLPFCLQAWRDDLRGIQGYGGFVEHLYPVLADRHVFDLHLNAAQAKVVSEFMQHAILEEIDQQRGLIFQGSAVRPYRWFGALITYGVLRPDLYNLWNSWWASNTIGRAIAAVQYVSCLMYPNNENPVFAPWTPDRGGGPPLVWRFEGHLYAHCWLQPNVRFLRQMLTVQNVRNALLRATARLSGEPEYSAAVTVKEDFPLCTATVKSRCAELPQFLETVQQSITQFSWSA